MTQTIDRLRSWLIQQHEGDSDMSMVHEEVVMPASVDQYPPVQRHNRQLAALQEKFTAARVRHASLLTERDSLRSQHRQGEVAELLGDGRPGDAATTADRLAHIDEDIAAAVEAVSAAQDAIHVLEVIAAGGRESAQRDVDAKVAAAAVQTYRTMHPLVQQVAALNAQLIILLQRCPTNPGVPFIPLPETWFTEWLSRLDALGGK